VVAFIFHGQHIQVQQITWNNIELSQYGIVIFFKLILIDSVTAVIFKTCTHINWSYTVVKGIWCPLVTGTTVYYISINVNDKRKK
jgi:hypothetical protein